MSATEAAAAAQRARAYREGPMPGARQLSAASSPPAPAPKPPRATPPRAPEPPRELKADADGNVRMVVTRAGMEIDGGKRPRPGEIVVVPLETAQAWLRNCAADIAGPMEGGA